MEVTKIPPTQGAEAGTVFELYCKEHLGVIPKGKSAVLVNYRAIKDRKLYEKIVKKASELLKVIRGLVRVYEGDFYILVTEEEEKQSEEAKDKRERWLQLALKKHNCIVEDGYITCLAKKERFYDNDIYIYIVYIRK